MKKYISLIGIVALFLLLHGCKGFLDRNPLEQNDSKQYWKTKADFDMALTAVYSHLQNGMFSVGIPQWDLLTDNGYGQHNNNNSQGIARGDIFPSTGGYVSELYDNCYSGIARSNIFLAKLTEFQGSDIDAPTKLRYEAENRFMRAYYYYMLYACYGDVPLVTEPLDLETQFQPKVPAAEILEQIIEDVDFAIDNLPEMRYSAGGGRLVKTSAQALKLRVLMYIGYGNTGTADQSILTEARDIAREIMQAGYILAPGFESVFRDGTQEGNPEIIFSIKFLAPNNATNMDQIYGDWLVVSPLKNLFDAYEQGDIRRDLTIFDREISFGGPVHRPSNNIPTGYGVKKFLTPGLIPYGYSTQSQQDWVMFRYAEILLSFAEAENELLGTPSQQVKDAINAIRERADLDKLPETLTKVQMREAIRKERRLELAFEGLRYFDLKRWRIAKEVLNNVTDGIIQYRFEDKFYHWPLPQPQIDRSNGVLIQNPDY